ncbi:MAG: putative toxin-antitoxin system toxin component, PIN family [Candidatus Micrarchaeota archaeon]
MKVVLDTNVLISATFWYGEASNIVELVHNRKIICFTSKALLEEYNSIVHSEEIVEKIQEKHLAIKSSLIKALEIFQVVEPKRKIDCIKDDPDDNRVLECAVEAQVDCIITYDKYHLLKLKEFEGIKIISPTEFLEMEL